MNDPMHDYTALETPRWMVWLKSHIGFVILCILTVGLYLFFEQRIVLAWWGVVLAYLIFVILAIMGAKFLHDCDQDTERMVKK